MLSIGIAGGSCSGKTTLAKALQKLAPDHTLILSQDAYYKDLSLLSVDERSKINFDHPASLDFELMHQHLTALKNNQSIQMPQYDFVTHSRKKETLTINPKPIVIVEGILIFTQKNIRQLLNLKVFIDAQDKIRLLRRIDRDQIERGRSIGSIQAQYHHTVAPMYDKFVEPSKRYADICVSGEHKPEIALQIVQSKITNKINELTQPSLLDNNA